MLPESKLVHTIFLLLLLTLATLLIPHHAQANRIVRAGTYNFKPMVYSDPDGSAHGFFVEILNHVARKENWEIQYAPGTWQEGLDRLTNGQIDLVLCAGYTEERDKYLDFPKEFLLLDWGLVYKSKRSSVSSIIDLEGKTVSVLKGSVYSAGFQELIRQFNIKTTTLEMNQVSDVFKAIDTGKADVGVTANIAGILNEPGHNVERTPIIFTPVKLGYAVHNGRNADLIAALDREIAALKSDRTSIYHHELGHLLGKQEAFLPKEIYWLVSGVAAALLFAIAFIFILRRQVRIKTQSIQAAAEQYQNILQSTTDGFWCVTRQGRLLDANKRYMELSGYSREELLGMPIEHLDFRESAAEVKKRIETIVESGFSRFESQHRRKDGTVWDVEVSTSYLPAKDEMVAFLRDITAIKRAANEKIAEYARFKGIMDSLDALVYVADMETHELLFINEYGTKLFGNIEGQICWQLLQRGQSGPCAFCTNDKLLLENGEPADTYIWEFRNTVTGNWYQCRDKAIRWHDNRLVRMEIASDITDRKRAEDKIEKRLAALTQPLDTGTISFEELFNLDDVQRLQDTFAHATGVASIITTPDGVPLTAPSNFTRLCNDIIRKTEKGCARCYKSDALLGRLNPDGPNILKCLSSGLWDAGAGITAGGQHIANWLIGQVRDENLSEDEMVTYAREIGADEGSFLEAYHEIPPMPYKHFEQIALALFTIARQLSGTAYQNTQQARFINELKNADDALRKSEELHRILSNELQIILNTSPVGICQLKERKVIRANSAFDAIFGYQAGATLNMDTSELYATRELYEETGNRAYQLLSEEGTYTQDVLMKKNDDSLFWCNITGHAIAPDNLEEGSIWILQDISERKHAEEEKEKMEAQLWQAQKMESVGRLAGGVAHDFNNMLGVILGHSELGLMTLEPDHPVCSNLKEISRTAERSADLTRQLLAFARKQTVTPKVLNLNDTITTLLKMLQRLIGEDIHLIWQPAPDLWYVRIDLSQVDQILANLCVNARDAIENTGHIIITTENITIDSSYCTTNPEAQSGEYVRLTVSDNGSGIDKETLAHIFEPFYTTKGLGKGTGLGLATVYGVVKQNNGFIDIFSEPGRGATFSIYLPHHEGIIAQSNKIGDITPAPRGQETILLVEDEPAILNITGMMLDRQGYIVIKAATPGEALQLARNHSGDIHLLMTDVIMPEMNGRDLAKNVLALYPRVKRLFMSGYTADIIAHHGVLDDGVHFIQKPFLLPDMAAKVREVLDGE